MCARKTLEMVCAHWWYSFRFTLSHGSESFFFSQPTLRFAVAAIDARSGKKIAMRYGQNEEKWNGAAIHLYLHIKRRRKTESCRWSSEQKNANNAMKMNCAGFFCSLLLKEIDCYYWPMYILISVPCSVCLCISQLIVVARWLRNDIRSHTNLFN